MGVGREEEPSYREHGDSTTFHAVTAAPGSGHAEMAWSKARRCTRSDRSIADLIIPLFPGRLRTASCQHLNPHACTVVHPQMSASMAAWIEAQKCDHGSLFAANQMKFCSYRTSWHTLITDTTDQTGIEITE